MAAWIPAIGSRIRRALAGRAGGKRGSPDRAKIAQNGPTGVAAPLAMVAPALVLIPVLLLLPGLVHGGGIDLAGGIATALAEEWFKQTVGAPAIAHAIVVMSFNLTQQFLHEGRIIDTG